MTARDPCIKQHPPKMLRWFAQRFKEMAGKHREEASNLDAKAARYLKRAEKLEEGSATKD